jgi:multidrug efflux system outer membrane protein
MKRTKTKRNRFLLTAQAILAVLLAGFVCSVKGADTLSLTQCVQLAEKNSPELAIAEGDIKAARLSRDLTSKERWPQIKLAADAGYAPFSHSFGYDPAVSNGGELGARVVAEQSLYSGGTFGLKLQQQQNNFRRQSIAWQRQERDLVYQVRQAFINTLLAQGTLDLRKQRVVRLSAYTSLVNRLNKAGTARSVDLLNTKAELGRAEIDASAAEQTLKSARMNLMRLLGWGDTTDIVLSGSLDSLLVNSSDSGQTGLPEIRNGLNLELNQARIDSTQSRLDLELTRRTWRPTLSVTADAGYVTSRENLLLAPGERYRSIGYSVGVNLEMPLWDWGKRKTEIAKGVINLQAAVNNISLVARDLRYEYQDARSGFENARSRLLSIRTVLSTSESNFLLNKAQYADGSANASDVLLAEQSLTDTRQTELETLAEIQLLKARLDMLTQPAQDSLP